MLTLIQTYKDMLAQLEADCARSGDSALAGMIVRAREGLSSSREGLQQRAGAMQSVVDAIDDAGAAADPGEGESRAYENELEAAIAIRNEFEAAVRLLARP